MDTTLSKYISYVRKQRLRDAEYPLRGQQQRETNMLFPAPPTIDTKLVLSSEQGEESHTWAWVTGALWGPGSVNFKANGSFQYNLFVFINMCRKR